MFHEQNFKRVFPKQQNAKLLSSSTQPFKCAFQRCRDYVDISCVFLQRIRGFS